MKDSVDVNPSALRALADRLRGLADRAGSVHTAAVGGEGGRSLAQFPQLSVGQQAGKVWADARPAFTDAAALAQRALAQLAEGFRTSADGYEQADGGSAQQLDDLR